MRGICLQLGSVLIFLLMTACVDNFSPPATTVEYNLLVVDGILNADSTVIRLTRTQTLDGKEELVKEENAIVQLEDMQDSYYAPFNPLRDGYYTSSHIELTSERRYRLHITLQNGSSYVSDYVDYRQTPGIDSLSWTRGVSGIVPGIFVNANTHDPENKTVFYLWNFVETWEYNSRWHSGIILEGNSVRYRLESEDIYHCWKTLPSTTLMVFSTTALEQDIVSEFPLIFISYLNPKLSYKYTSLVDQYAVTREAYEYWQSTKKNSEAVGSVFGQLPTKVTGNFHCLTNPGEEVIGFFSAASRQQKRIYISGDNFDVPHQYENGYEDCVMIAEDNPISPIDLLIAELFEGRNFIGYSGSTAYCVDCRFQGGVTVKPPFWH